MNILIACEFSGAVRDAFAKRGHHAVSCDLLPSDTPGEHLQMDIFEAIKTKQWDMLIGFPPCTDLCVSGARWFAQKRADGRQQASIAFFLSLANCGIEKIALENPVGIMSRHYRKPDQIIQPWMFGHTEQKATCLWLQGLPLLRETNNVRDAMMLLPKSQRERVHRMPPGPDRWKERSRTFSGFADAMARFWG